MPTATAAIIPNALAGQPAPTNELDLRSLQFVEWTLYAENGGFVSETSTFTYGAKQIVAIGGVTP